MVSTHSDATIVNRLAPPSPYHLTPEQIQFFDDNGYLILRNWIPKHLLARLQEAGDRWIEQGLASEGNTISGGANVEKIVDQDFTFANRPGGRRVLFRVNYLHNKGESASLELLGSPHVLAVAESLNGRNFVPTYESMVFKMKGDGEQIPWHQDAVFPRRYRVWNYDLYLDASAADAGALRVIPRSHKQKYDACQFAQEWQWNHPDMIVVEMQPGDVLIHDDMLLHGSPRIEGKALRRTIYYEFRSVEQILDEGPWDQAWIEKRLRLIPVGLRRYREHYPRWPQFEWNIAPQHRPAPTGDEQTELRIVHTIHTPGSYCSAGSSPKA